MAGRLMQNDSPGGPKSLVNVLDVGHLMGSNPKTHLLAACNRNGLDQINNENDDPYAMDTFGQDDRTITFSVKITVRTTILLTLLKFCEYLYEPSACLRQHCRQNLGFLGFFVIIVCPS